MVDLQSESTTTGGSSAGDAARTTVDGALTSMYGVFEQLESEVQTLRTALAAQRTAMTQPAADATEHVSIAGGCFPWAARTRFVASVRWAFAPAAGLNANNATAEPNSAIRNDVRQGCIEFPLMVASVRSA